MSDTTSKPIQLQQPIQRPDGPITAVVLRRPDAGALRGLKLTDVLQMDVNAMIRLLPRISQPALLPDDVAALDPADLLELSSEVVCFFVGPEQLAAEMSRLS